MPTGWSITAVDDIIGKGLVDRVKISPTIDEYRVFSADALANNVCVLLMPTPWMFEGLEMWHMSAPNYHVDSDFEFYEGRKNYASNLAGAYYAARLPVAEYLDSSGRQAGAIAFLEVMNDWIPLGRVALQGAGEGSTDKACGLVRYFGRRPRRTIKTPQVAHKPVAQREQAL